MDKLTSSDKHLNKKAFSFKMQKCISLLPWWHFLLFLMCSCPSFALLFIFSHLIPTNGSFSSNNKAPDWQNRLEATEAKKLKCSISAICGLHCKASRAVTGPAIGVMLFVLLFPSRRSCPACVLGSINRGTQLPPGCRVRTRVPVWGFLTQN